MGARGPKRLPANVHLIRGNPSRLPADRLRDAIAPEVCLPEPPSHLSDPARAEWDRVGPELEALGLVSELDRAALAAYCQAYGRWVQAEERLRELGDEGLIETTSSGYKQIGVWLQISNRAVEQMAKFLAEFGMSPSARSRVTPGAQLDLFDGTQAQDPARLYFT